MTRSPAPLVLAVALAVFACCCLLGPGGLLTSWHAADVSYYGQLGAHLRDGEVPYRTLYVEYPPGALPVFVMPAVSEPHFVELFKILMALCGAATLVAIAAAVRTLDPSPLRLAVALAPLATVPVLLGSVFLNRFDPWPMLLTAAALVALVRGRVLWGAGWLAAAVVTKIFAAAAVPVAAVRVARSAGTGALRRAALVFAGLAAIVVLPFAALGAGGLAYSFYIQLTRHLEIESLAASLLLAADRLGLYQARIVSGKPGSQDLAGSLPTALGVVSTLAAVGGLLAVAYWYARGREGRERLLVAFAGAIAAYVALGKVLSPQYLVWLLPVVAVVGGRVGYLATGLLAAALLLTRLEFSHWDSINAVGPAVWLLVARNVVVVSLFAALAVHLARRPDSLPAA